MVGHAEGYGLMFLLIVEEEQFETLLLDNRYYQRDLQALGYLKTPMRKAIWGRREGIREDQKRRSRAAYFTRRGEWCYLGR